MSESHKKKDKAPEIIDTTVDPDSEDDHSDSDAEDFADHNVVDAAAPSTSTSQKKKKKKKSKAKKLINSLRVRDNEIPQEVVDRILDKVKSDAATSSLEINAENITQALQQMKIMDVVKGKAGPGGLNSKDMGEHKFWATQPVPQPGEGVPLEEGYIEPSKPHEEVRQEPYPLPKDFEWATLDINDPVQNKEVYDLLSLNYVEDDHAAFRFQYSAEFLAWALKPPGYHPEWHIGVRVSANKKLVAFISGVPMTLRVRQHVIQVSEINYLYYHRSLNIPKLVETKFCHVPRNMTLARMIRLNKLPSKTSVPGLREMQEKDVVAATTLFNQYMKRFDLVPFFTLEEARHQFLSGSGEGEVGTGGVGRREGQVTWSYVVEDPETGTITDFFSFYSLPSTVINNTTHPILEAAYLFYYATEVGLQPSEDQDEKVKKRLLALVGDALIVANEAKFDVFNALTLMDNVPILQDLRFGVGDGFLNFYLYNWRTLPFAGMNSEGTVPAGKGVGVVML
ncbi:hypothetical protein NLJ89_g1978 [Agrocybe chaxingu]|uniref:Glycylpeptide N-tetradecanoyltransferase n=1 Tax=Agrocybe chaxingu TaxID=84603 RepID=A0A9W8TE92_9AGAR|nr:hypothetical protein NLJ89_g1978 [Agrocybe chaxingu]